MATIALYAGKLNQMPGLINDARKSVDKLKTELSDLQKKAYNVDTDVCDLSEVISSIQASAQTQENRIAELENFQANSEEFINEVIRIDQNVADTVNQNKENFYKQYEYLKPECEKSGWEKFCDGLESIGEWCKEHWKVVVAAIVIVAIGVAAILTGGTLAAILAVAFWSALKGAAVGAILGGLASIVEGESFWDGFENGFLFGAFFGGAFGALGKAAQLLGSSSKFLLQTSAGQFLIRHLNTVVKVAKISGTISLSMFGFDMLALGSGLFFGKDNWLTSVNRTLHQNAGYNVFQFTVGMLAVFSNGLFKGKQMDALRRMSDVDREAYLQTVEKEPQITAKVQEITANAGGKLEGLDYKLKTPTSTYEKMYGRSTSKPITEMNDLIRYTEIFEPDQLAKGTNLSLQEFEANGYSVTKVKNTWGDTSNPYNGINTTIVSPEGQVFEVQFHTLESFNLKNGLLHSLYEQCRVLSSTDPLVAQLNNMMFELSESLQKPLNIFEVLNK